jgi:hypothetical protein
MKKMSLMYCGHANESPDFCLCPENCYCKDHSCKDKMPPLSDEFNKYQAGQANPPCPGGCFNCTCKDEEDFTAYTDLEQLSSTFTSEQLVNSNSQPKPVQNELPKIPDLVIADMQARAEYGYNKYGTYLQAFNGRDALKDAYQEAIDLCQYLRQAIYERDEE